jgi:D-alanyl-lipoteichoic acid acyltransferase DltB (MBOAT superfamily)
MLITSVDWLSWMAATTILYWLSPERFRDIVLAILSIVYLGTQSFDSAAILLFFTLLVFFTTNRSSVSTIQIAAASILIIVVLGYYKVTTTYMLDGDSILQSVIPLGISYYSFRCLHFLIEKYKGTIGKQSFRNFFGYLLFLPTMPAGPIHRYPDFNRDMRRKRWNSAMFSEGLERILFGYVKIIVLGNYLTSIWLAEKIAMIDDNQLILITYLTVVRKAVNGYLLFSGYSDIAIGFALLLGYRVLENFNWPFFRKNISEFWRSWHISLSSWCREYVYMMVMSTTRKPALAALSTMLVMGLWHEVSVRYILWGVYHGVGIACWQYFQTLKVMLPSVENRYFSILLDGLSIFVTFNFVALGFVIVQEKTLSDSISIFLALLSLD